MNDEEIIKHCKRYKALYLKQLKELPYETARYNYLFELSKLFQHNQRV